MDFRTDFYNRYVTTFKKRQLDVNDDWLQSYWEWVRRKYLPLLSRVDRKGLILEVGCGPGYLMEFLRKEGFENVQGIDISEEQVELACRRELNAQVADVFEFLKSSAQTYDTIFAIDFLEHFSKDELMELLPLLHKSLKDGGRAIFEVPNGQGLFSGQVIYGDLTHVTTFTPESLQQLLSLHGFTDIAFEETGPVPKNLVGWIRVFAWKCIRQLAGLMKKIETGKTQLIWTENMICHCRK